MFPSDKIGTGYLSNTDWNLTSIQPHIVCIIMDQPAILSVCYAHF